MDVYVGGARGGEAINLALAHVLARRADDTGGYEAIHIYNPAGRSVVFGRRDTRLPGFPAAVRAARDAGFEPLVRAVGGRAVAYTDQAVVIHHVRHECEPAKGHDARFLQFGSVLADALSDLGVPAQVGAVPGEYCPGAHSISSLGTVKLAGTAQRILRRAWLFASLVVVGNEGITGSVLTDVYRHLGHDFDPASVGSLSAVNDSVKLAEVTTRLIDVYGRSGEAVPLAGAGGLLGAAAATAHDHRVLA